MPYLTGDSTALCQISFSAPTDTFFWAAFVGALSRLTIEENWETRGTISAEDAADMFAAILENVDYCSGGGAMTPAYGKLRQVVPQSIAHNNYTLISYDNIDITENVITNALYIEIIDAGIYNVQCQCSFANGTTGYRAIRIQRPGYQFANQMNRTEASTISRLSVSSTVALAAGDRVQAYAYQNSGAAMNLQTTDDYVTLFVARIA